MLQSINLIFFIILWSAKKVYEEKQYWDRVWPLLFSFFVCNLIENIVDSFLNRKTKAAGRVN